MDRTLVATSRVEVRGGTLTVTSGDDEGALRVGPEPLIVGRRPGCNLVLADKKVSATHLEVVATEQGVRLRDLGSTNGTFLGDHRIVEAFLTKAALVRCGDTELAFRPGGVERVAVSKSEQFGPLVGGTREMRALFEKLRLVAPTTVSVLIEGETGTGKELVAQAIHDASDRADRPLVVIDCAAIPPSLVESELFGHEKGAFTSSVGKRISPFVEAAGGTVFLDELGELPLEVQPRLLRVLADQRLKSVGANAYQPVNVRVVAATRRDLLEDINRGAFRDDLFFRIAQTRVKVPSLRERRDDLPLLVRRMMERAGKGAAFRRVTPEAIDRLHRHDWPGNVRELHNLVTVALAFDKGSGPIDLAAHLSETPAKPRKTGAAPDTDRLYADWKSDSDKAFFTAQYEATDGNLNEMSRTSGLNRETVRAYLRKHRIGKYRKPGR